MAAAAPRSKRARPADDDEEEGGQPRDVGTEGAGAVPWAGPAAKRAATSSSSSSSQSSSSVAVAPPAPAGAPRAAAAAAAAAQQAGGARREFRCGAIVRVTMENFMTYERAEVLAEPGLNLVVGPNGSGKSSIVCAIFLCLGGDPKLLHRSEQVGEYVRSGQKAGWVELELYAANQHDHSNAVLRCIMRREGPRSWLLNGKNANATAVQEFTRRLKIMVDNICVFLPQERVAEVIKLGPTDLLLNTESAVDPDIRAQHEKLIKLNSEFQERKRSGDEDQRELENARKNLADLERRADDFKRREELVTEQAVLEKWKLWRASSDAHLLLQERKSEAEDARKKLEEAAESLAPLQQRIDDATDQIKRAQENLHRTSRAVEDANAERERKLANVAHFEEEVASLRAELEKLEGEQARRERELADCRKDVAQVEAELARLPDDAAVEEQRRPLAQRKSKLEADREKLDEQLADADQELAGAQREVLAAQRAVSDLSNAESARYDAINRITRGELDRNERALAELRRQGRLRSEVWGPVFKHVRVGKPLHGAYLEHVVQSTSRMIGYICELQEDASLVGRELECFAVIRSPSAAAAQAVQVPAPLRQRGVVCLAELVTGTPEVINALMEKTSLGRTCVSEREIDQRSVLSTRKGDGMLTNLIMGPKNYSVAFSRYDQHSVTRVAQIRTTANFFNVGVNEDEVQARQKKVIELRSQHAAVSRKRTELDAKRKEVEVQLQEAVTALARIDTGCRKRKTLEQRRAALRKRVGELSEPQSEATKQELATKLKRAAQQLADKVGELRDAWQNCLGGVLERNGLELHKTYSELRKAALQRHLSEREAAMRSLEDAVARSEQLVTEAQRRSAEARRRADAEAPWPEWKRRFTEEIQALSQASIHARIAQIEESVRGMLQDNDVLQRLEETRRRVADLGLRCTQCENALQNMQRDMSKIRDTFLPRLRDVVNAVDRAFSASFSRMRCQGEVKLLDSDENYAKWELRINVSFRAGQDLKPFGETLSGGERSVVTILFLLALQRVTEVPFRVIDEINQAMDAQNERHVFEQIVESARDKAMPCQYFLLTPKLLPGLDFTNVSVFIAFNGQYSIDSRQWQEVLRRLS